MKKSLLLLMAASVTAFVACGPSAEEKARIEQARQDSIEQVRVQDSLNAAEAVARQQAIQDSIVMADSLRMVAMQDSMAKMKANMTKPKPKPKPVIKPQDVKAGQGKG